MSIETGDDCPICAEAFDSTDKRFIPCFCGYQICLWCYRKIQESDASRCPKCRRPYTGEFRLKSLEENMPRCPNASCEEHNLPKDKDKQQARSRGILSLSSGSQNGNPFFRVPGSKERQEQAMYCRDVESDGTSSAECLGDGSAEHSGTSPTPARHTPSKDLRDVRVIRRDLCYVVGLPLEVVVEEAALKSFDFFGKYGKVVNIIVNRNPNFKAPDKKKSCALYVTFSSSEEAKAAITDLDESYYEGRRLKASYGTTKYCSNFLRKAKCQNRQCFYLHEKGADEDSFTVAEMTHVKETSRGLTCSALLASEFQRLDWKDSMSLFGKSRDETIQYFTSHPDGRCRVPFKPIFGEVEARRKELLTPSTFPSSAQSSGDSKASENSVLSVPVDDSCGKVIDLDALVLASVNGGGLIQQAYQLYHKSRIQQTISAVEARETSCSLIVLPPPPSSPADPVVHPSLQLSTGTCHFNQIDPNSQYDEIYLESLLPSSLLETDDFVPSEENALTTLQPGHFVPMAPSSQMGSYVTPADQVALRTEPVHYGHNTRSRPRRAKSDRPPGFENYSTIHPPIVDINRMQFATATGFYSPLLIATDYQQSMQQVMSSI